MAGCHLAHFNWATMRGDPGSDVVAGFINAVDKVNALADRSPGFVWRFPGDEADAARDVGWEAFSQNPRVIASFSVWESTEALEAYVYKTVHGAFFRRGTEWFEREGARGHVLWWVPEGHIPSVAEAHAKAMALAANGPSDEAFSFAQVVPAQ